MRYLNLLCRINRKALSTQLTYITWGAYSCSSSRFWFVKLTLIILIYVLSVFCFLLILIFSSLVFYDKIKKVLYFNTFKLISKYKEYKIFNFYEFIKIKWKLEIYFLRLFDLFYIKARHFLTKKNFTPKIIYFWIYCSKYWNTAILDCKSKRKAILLLDYAKISKFKLQNRQCL